MMTKIERDVDVMPAFVAEFLAEDERVRVAALVTGFSARGAGPGVWRRALAHALQISTWESLCAGDALDAAEAADLMVGAVLAAVQPPPRRFRSGS